MNKPIHEPKFPKRRPGPFEPGDPSVLDLASIQNRADATRQALTDAQIYLTRLRYGPGPDNQDPPLREVTRADGQWPFLLIRSFPGDVGRRPLPQDVPPRQSPDIILTPADPAAEPTIIDRTEIAALKSREIAKPLQGQALDVWVHVWNLGHSQATGVRIRVRLFTLANPVFTGAFLGGVALDLDDRLGGRAHCVVKAATFNAPGGLGAEFTVMAIADCLSDPVAMLTPIPGLITAGTDRHAAHRSFF